MNDTPPDIEKMIRERLMAMSGAERFRIGSEMFDAARRMVLASLPDDLSERERKRLLFERVYGECLPGAETDGENRESCPGADTSGQPHFPKVR